MRHQSEAHLAHVEVIAHDTLYCFMVDARHLCDLLPGWVSLAFDQHMDSVNLSSVTRPLRPRQISKLGATAIESRGLLLGGPQRDRILAIDFLEFGADCLVGGYA
jgi:hypothetical protein